MKVTILNVMDVTSMKTLEYRLFCVLSMFNAVYLLKENYLFLLSILFILIIQTLFLKYNKYQLCAIHIWFSTIKKIHTIKLFGHDVPSRSSRLRT